MNKLYTLFLTLLIGGILLPFWQAMAQSPEKMSFQAVIRDGSGELVKSSEVAMRIQLLQGSEFGASVYVETHKAVTNANGLLGIEIGTGTVVSGDFSSIDWSAGPYFLKTETDPAGGTDYSITGTSQVLSVPYALHAKTAETVENINYTEADPLFTSSPAKNISTTDMDNLGNLSGINTGDQDGSETKVTAGANINIAGTGTNADPYEISATGNTRISSFQPPGCQYVSDVTTTYQKIANLGTFTKGSAATIIELTLQTHVYVASSQSTGVIYELRVNDEASSNGFATVALKDVGVSQSVSLTGLFTGLTSGSHTVSLWVKTTSNTATNAFYDPGCWNSVTNNVIVKEFY